MNTPASHAHWRVGLRLILLSSLCTLRQNIKTMLVVNQNIGKESNTRF